MRTLIFCADDFGISPGVNSACLELAESKVLNAVSVMTVFAHSQSEWNSLVKLRPAVRVGWHVTLTQGDWRAFYQSARRGTLDEKFVARELRAQWDCFTERIGTTPDFIDGHHHVHQFPTVREALMELLHEKRARIPVRTSGISPKGMLAVGLFHPSLLLRNAALGMVGKQMKQLLGHYSVPTNRSLLGSYDPDRQRFADVFRFYRSISSSENDIFYCHPGHPDRLLAERDGFVEKREEEFAFLKQMSLTPSEFASPSPVLTPDPAQP